MTNRHFLTRHLPAIAWAAVIFILLSLPSSSFPKAPIYVPSLDKLIHAAMFFIMALFLHRSFSVAPSIAAPLLLAVIAATLYGSLGEVYQMLLPDRSADVVDALSNGAGAFLYAAAARLKSGSKRKKDGH